MRETTPGVRVEFESARFLHARVELGQCARGRVLLDIRRPRKPHCNNIGELFRLEVTERQVASGQILVRLQHRQIDVCPPLHHARFNKPAIAARVTVTDKVFLALGDYVKVGYECAPAVHQEASPGPDALLLHRVDFVDAGLDVLHVERRGCASLCQRRQQHAESQEPSANAAGRHGSQLRSWHVQHCNPPRTHARKPPQVVGPNARTGEIYTSCRDSVWHLSGARFATLW